MLICSHVIIKLTCENWFLSSPAAGIKHDHILFCPRVVELFLLCVRLLEQVLFQSTLDLTYMNFRCDEFMICIKFSVRLIKNKFCLFLDVSFLFDLFWIPTFLLLNNQNSSMFRSLTIRFEFVMFYILVLEFWSFRIKVISLNLVYFLYCCRNLYNHHLYHSDSKFVGILVYRSNTFILCF